MPRRSRSARRSDAGPGLLDTLEFRLVGPFRGGRVGAVAGDYGQRNVFYFGSTGGGVWKTTDGGQYWRNVSDGFFQRASVGAIAVARSDSNVVYVGMGESCIRGNVSHGDGVYKSTDGGKTWTHQGLADTRNIGKVRVHPDDPNVAYVAALGHAHGPNTERGVFRTTDGGKTWRRVLYRGSDAGAIDLSIDQTNPRVVFASFWQARRQPWQLVSGGPGSGIFKSTDGGDTWVELSRKAGLPKGVLGKIGITVSPANPNRVYAVIEARDGAVFRSDDGGDTWQRLSEDRNLRQRAWYYHHIVADPQDPDTVWVLNVDAWRSIDGGQTFTKFPIPHGDNHDLWIDPKDPLRMIEGNDGGATVTFNGGQAWSTLYNQPTSEFYHVTTDNRVPYRVYGSQQDNTSMCVPSRGLIAGITHGETVDVGGGEAGYIAVRPDDPDIVYAGEFQGILTRYDHRTGQARNVSVWPEYPTSGWGAKDLRYRFQWTYPIVISPHDPNTLYVTGNRVFRSTDEGHSWEVLSPDLTRNDLSKLEASGGPITKDNTGAEYYATVFAFAESPLQKGLLWAGSDDGLVHVSRDGGATWKNVTPKALPAWAVISMIEPSPHDAATAYLAALRYKLDDFRPWVFKTTDHGRTWTKITAGLPTNVVARAVREDPVRADLLYAGTETGLFVSLDGGRSWRRAMGNLPVVPIHDLVVKDGDLVVGTHGRSFWVLEDTTPIREWRDPIALQAAHLFTPRRTLRFRVRGGFASKPQPGRNYRFTGTHMLLYELKDDDETGDQVETYLDAGKNPPEGVIVQYWLRERPAEEVTLTFLDARGRKIRTYTSRPEPKGEEQEATEGIGAEGAEPAPGTTAATPPPEPKEPRVARKKGLNRFVWNGRYPDAARVEDEASMEEYERALQGPVAPPGPFRVQLRVGDRVVGTASFETYIEPRVPASQQDLESQFRFLMALRDKLSDTHEAVTHIRDLRLQIGQWEKRLTDRGDARPLVRAAARLGQRLVAIEDALIQFRAKSRQDTLHFPVRLNAQLAGLIVLASQADAPPTVAQEQVAAELSRRVDAQLEKLHQLEEREVRAFNQQARRLGFAALLPRATAPARGARVARAAARPARG